MHRAFRQFAKREVAEDDFGFTQAVGRAVPLEVERAIQRCVADLAQHIGDFYDRALPGAL